MSKYKIEKIRFKGEIYICDKFKAVSGDVFDVAEIGQDKAEQLLRDFPNDWEVVKDGKEK